MCSEKVKPGARIISTAMVSPRARPRPSIDAATAPLRPKGSTTVLITSQRVAPSASAASSCRGGVCRNTSRETAVMIGRTITASTTEAEARLRMGAVGSPAKSAITGSPPTQGRKCGQTGQLPRVLLRKRYSGSRRGTSQMPPQRP